MNGGTQNKKLTSTQKRFLDETNKRVEAISQHPLLLEDVLDGRVLRKFTNKELLINVCQQLLDAQRLNRPMTDAMYDILNPYLKKKYC